MKALIVRRPGELIFEDVPVPDLKDNELLIKVVRAGICGTDIAIYTGSSSFVRDGLISYPVRFGHEWSGTVESAGRAVTSFKKGDRVISDNSVSCGLCRACAAGRYGDCQSSRAVGTVNCWDGCFAEYIVMPEHHIYKFGDSVSFDMAALAEPLSVANDGFRSVNLTQESTAVIIGTGPIGFAAAALAKYYKAGKIIMIGRSDYKLSAASAAGATDIINNTRTDAVRQVKALSGGRGADFVVEASGSEAALNDAIDMTAPRGLISAIGFYEKNAAIPIDRLVLNAINLQGANGSYGNLEAVKNIIESYDLKLEHIITHRVKFNDCMDFFLNEKLYHNQKIKSMVEFD